MLQLKKMQSRQAEPKERHYNHTVLLSSIRLILSAVFSTLHHAQTRPHKIGEAMYIAIR